MNDLSFPGETLKAPLSKGAGDSYLFPDVRDKEVVSSGTFSNSVTDTFPCNTPTHNA